MSCAMNGHPLATYIEAAQLLDGLDRALIEDAVVAAEEDWQRILARLARPEAAPSPGDEDRLYRYRVPQLSADGSCTLVDELAPEPYDLAPVLGGRSPATTRWLAALDGVLERVQARVGAGWMGIYGRFEPPEAEPRLVKLAYRGLPSRAEFPLTSEFAQRSTNTTVALTGRAVVLEDVTAHAASGGAYYVCDPGVRSEVCLPVFESRFHRVVGIVDAEAPQVGFFQPKRIAELIALCLSLSGVLPAGPLPSGAP